MNKPLYWTNPLWIVFIPLTSLYLLALLSSYTNTKSQIHVDNIGYMHGFLLLISIGSGIYATKILYSARYYKNNNIDYLVIKNRNKLKYIYWSYALLILIAYAVWFGELIVNPSSIISIIHGNAMNARDSISTVPGITTLTQLTLPFIILHILISRTFQNISYKYKCAFYSIIALTAIRSFLWSERLALIEIIIPIVLYAARFSKFRNKSRNIYFYAPIFGLPVFFMIFGIFEYFRSWPIKQYEYEHFWSYILDRILLYYSTSINNGVGFISTSNEYPLFTGEFLFDFIYKIPFLNLTNTAWLKFQFYLFNYGDLEFNNPCGLFLILADIGLTWGILFCFLLGVATQLVYTKYVSGAISGLMLYPILYLTLLEILRFFYLSDSRSVYSITGSLIVIYLIRRSVHRHEN